MDIFSSNYIFSMTSDIAEVNISQPTTSVFPTPPDENSPNGRNFAPKIAIPKKHQNKHFLQQEFWQKLLKIAHFAVTISKVTKNRPNFAGDFCKNLIASLTPKIAHLAKIRHSWER